MLDFILKWLTIMAESDGVGLNSEQFTISMSTCSTEIGLQIGHA